VQANVRWPHVPNAKAFDQDRFFAILRAIAGAKPGTADPVELTARLRDELLRLGSRGDDNVRATDLLEVGPVDVLGSPEKQRLGLRLRGSKTALADLFWSVEEEPVPRAVREANPAITEFEWQAAARALVLLLSALESQAVPASDPSNWQKRPSHTPQWGIDPRHSVLPDPHNYDLVGLNLQLAPPHNAEPFIDLTFESRRRKLTLRFFSPRQLSLEEDGPSSLGLEILDISAHRLDQLTVRVDNYESSGGAVRFVARTVEVVSDETREAAN
jgi:hypothetical protein